jgi:lipopolysaccharide export system protein LptA
MLCVLALIPAAAWGQPATVWHPDPDKPVQIMAAKLAVDDATRTAIFSGDVRLTQGDVRLRCSRMHVHYIPGARADPGRVTRVECEP